MKSFWKQLLAPDRHHTSSYTLGRKGVREGYSAGCNLQPHRQMPLNPTHCTFNLFMIKWCYLWFVMLFFLSTRLWMLMRVSSGGPESVSGPGIRLPLGPYLQCVQSQRSQLVVKETLRDQGIFRPQSCNVVFFPCLLQTMLPQILKYVTRVFM